MPTGMSLPSFGSATSKDYGGAPQTNKALFHAARAQQHCVLDPQATRPLRPLQRRRREPIRLQKPHYVGQALA